jgi:geranylgeranyl pyrophosphate synthase
MDDDDLRRGKPSCHKAFGEAVALLAGDALLNLAFGVMSDEGHRRPFLPERVLAAVNCLAGTAGLGGMIGGQAIDMAQEGQSTPPPLLERMYSLKTGALLGAAAGIGCILAGAAAAERQGAVEYAHHLGFAFQLTDDILDVTGDEALLGKPIGSDAANNKTTYVSLYGLAAARQAAVRSTAQAKEALDKLPGDTRFLKGLADMLAARQN